MEIADHDVRGMAWWSSLSDSDRSLWLSRAHGDSPAAAWQAYSDNQISFQMLVHAHHERYPDDLLDAYNGSVMVRDWPTS